MAIARFLQGFETGTDGVFGVVSQTASGSPASAEGGFHALVGSGAFTRFGGYQGLDDGFDRDFTAQVKIYLDPTAMSAGDGFDYSVAAFNQTGLPTNSGGHLQDYIFHVTKDTSTGDLLVGTSNNASGTPREDLETLPDNAVINSAGWYTFEHSTSRNGTTGELEVTFRVLNASDTEIFSRTQQTGNDYDTEFGGHGYGWFVGITGSDLAVDSFSMETQSEDLVEVRNENNAVIGLYDTVENAKAAIDAGDISGTTLVVSTNGLDDAFYYVSSAQGMSIQDAVDAAGAGDEINLSSGIHVKTGELSVDKEVAITGAGQTGPGATVIQAAATAYGIHVTADNVTLSDFSLDASALTTPGGFGIKVNPTGGPTSSLTGLLVQDVTVTGAARSEIDLNGVDDSSLVRVTANGDNTGGVGIALSDSTGITLEDITTTGNNWGSIGVYSAGRSFEPGTNNITFLGSYSHDEDAGIYADEEIDSGSLQRTVVENLDMQAIYPAGVYKVQNDTFRDSLDGRSEDFTFFFGDEAEAVAFALGLTNGAADSVITVDATSDDVDAETGSTFIVGAGMSIQAAIDAASDGDTIQVAAGTFTENLTIDKEITLLGAQAGMAAMDAARSGGESVIDGAGTFGITVLADNVTIDGFEITGFGRDGINVRTLEDAKPGDASVGAYRTDVSIANNWIHNEDATGQRNGVVVGEFSGDPARSTEIAEVNALSITGNYIDIDSSGGRALAFTNHFDFVTFNGTTIDANTIESGSAALFAGAATDSFRFEAIEFINNDVQSGYLNSYNLFNSLVDGNTFNDIVVLGVDGSTVSGNTFNVADFYGLGLWGTEFGANASQNSSVDGNIFNFNQAATAESYQGAIAVRPGADAASIDF
ncbi:hypothetical protein AB9K41_00425, partial [Cribrihabitans sp. XS_ASV171]